MARGSTGSGGGSGSGGGAVSSVAGKTGAVSLVKGDVGLSNVDNTADTAKPVSTAAQTALDAKAPLASPTFTGTVSGVSAAAVGLGNVTNTSDTNKPVSTAQQAALDLKAPLASPTFTGTVSGVTAAMVGLGNVSSTIARKVASQPTAATASAYMTASATAQTKIGTSRIPHPVTVSGSNLRFLFTNWYSNASTYVDVDNAASIAITASVEISGIMYRLTFSGKQNVTIDGGGHIWSDPIALDVTAGQTIYSRTFITPTTNWYYNRFSYSPSGTGGWLVTVDNTAPGAANVPDTANQSLYGPSLITVEPSGAPQKSIQITGDSLAAGTGDGIGNSYVGRNLLNIALGGGGYVLRGLSQVGGVIQSALASDSATVFASAAGHFRRTIALSQSTHLFNEYGRNDISNGRTLAQLEADTITIWNLAYGRGKTVIQATITPLTTSTDGWLTTANQTVNGSANESVRVAFNTWLRDGAPILNGVAVASGSSATGTLRIGALGHPLSYLFDAADVAETARNSGIWNGRVNTRTGADMTTTAAGSTITSAGAAAFTSADIGRTITIAGAGTSGALYVGVITNYYSATQVGLGAGTPTAVSGAAWTIGDSYTRDGTHPDVYGATTIGAALATFMSSVN